MYSHVIVHSKISESLALIYFLLLLLVRDNNATVVVRTTQTSQMQDWLVFHCCANRWTVHVVGQSNLSAPFASCCTHITVHCLNHAHDENLIGEYIDCYVWLGWILRQINCFRPISFLFHHCFLLPVKTLIGFILLQSVASAWHMIKVNESSWIPRHVGPYHYVLKYVMWGDT